MTWQALLTQSSLNENTTLGILTNREEKKKLVDDIQDLRKLRTNINQSLEYYKIVRKFSEKSFVNCEEKSVRNLSKVRDGIGILKEELCKYSGIYCAKYEQDKEYRFEFNSCKNVSKNEMYFVQILTEGEKGKLGFWKMPVLLDVNEILSQCPIEDMRQVKNFVKLCKYYLDCQNSRKTQFEDLKNYVGELRTCSVQANIEIYTNIQLQIFILREIETDKCYDILLYIVYELTHSRPNKLIIDSLYEETLPENVVRKLTKFFKNFKLLELKSAFEKIVDEENGKLFLWKKSFKDKGIVIENDEVDSDCFSQEEGEMRSLTERIGNKEGGLQSEEDNEVINKKIQKIVNANKMSGKRKVRDENFTTRRTKKVNKIRLEEENPAKEKENELDNTTEEEDIKESQIKKKIPRKVKAKVFKTPRQSGKQTKLDFLKQNIENKKNRQIKDGEKSCETQNEEQNSKEQNQNVRSQVLESEVLNENQTNIQEITIKETKKGRKTAKGKKDENQNQIMFEEKGAKKKKKFKEIKKKTIKTTFNLPNFILERKKPAPSSINANFSNPISIGEKIGKNSTEIDREHTHPQRETEISEIIKVNKPIRKSPEKRPRSDSSNSDFEENFEEPNQSLLGNLKEIQEKVLERSDGLNQERGKKPAKRVKGRNTKSRK